MAIIYGVPVSPFVRKVMMAHSIKEIDYQLKMTMPQSEDAEFRIASPLGKIPAYRTDDGAAFSDSAVIVAFVERLDSPVSLYPQDNNQFAQALWLERYCDTQLMTVTSALYYQRVIGPKFFEHQADTDRVNELVDELLPKELDYIESQMTDNWLVGDSISIADVALASNLMNLMHADFSLTSWPKTNSFFARVQAHDFYKAQLAAEMTMFQ